MILTPRTYQNAFNAACQNTAGSPVRVKPDLREMKKTCYRKNIIKKNASSKYLGT